MFEFQKLHVYLKAKDFHKKTVNLCAEISMPKVVQNQLLRASFSIPLNIAEGSGRFSKADRRNFFVIARGSVFECIAILDILKDSGLSESRFKDLIPYCIESRKVQYSPDADISLFGDLSLTYTFSRCVFHYVIACIALQLFKVFDLGKTQKLGNAQGGLQ